ncbi:YcxB family protein [Cohnella silvisoli]|uniref:YcxB family protein n=1 Tax=Cohnella silvisoli TaxID=2873699 RepID=A0ABV1KLS1_9BACL|nr:YcxB family protein [Cohnella silvisoli]MCD9020875.1 YcxB family protein [Cohnella silvisoli]
MVELTFKLSDYMSKGIRDYHHHSLRFWISNGIGLAVFLFEIIFYWMTGTTSLLWIGLLLLFVLALSYVGSCYIRPMRFSSDKRYSKLFTLSIGDEEVSLNSEDANSQAKWEFIRKVWETDKFFYVFLDKRQFWIVPRDQFSDKGQEDLFRQIVGKHQKIQTGLIK